MRSDRVGAAMDIGFNSNTEDDCRLLAALACIGAS